MGGEIFNSFSSNTMQLSCSNKSHGSGKKAGTDRFFRFIRFENPTAYL